MLALRDREIQPSLLVSLLVEDPSIDLFGNEPVLLDGEWIGYVRAAGYGHTLGGAVGLAMVDHPEGVTPEWLAAAPVEVWTARGNRPVRLSAAPLYDPGRSRILARESP